MVEKSLSQRNSQLERLFRKVTNQKDTKWLSFILERGIISANERFNSKFHDNQTLVGLMVRQNKLDHARVLIQNGGYIEAAEAGRISPLMMAAIDDNHEMAEMLLKHGADPLYQDNEGWTALYWAATRDSKKVAKLLLKDGILKHGDLSSHVAARNGSEIALWILKEKGVGGREVNGKCASESAEDFPSLKKRLQVLEETLLLQEVPQKGSKRTLRRI